MFNIERNKLVSNLISLIKKGHLLLIGNPGSGKTWLIKKVANVIKEENIPYVIIHADSIKVDSLTDFEKALGIDYPLEEFFYHKSGGKRSILFIDALDAARSEAKQSIYRQFINLIQSNCRNWFIIASIRTYDIKHSQELINIFPSGIIDAPLDFIIPEVRFRHLYVPLLLETEISEAIEQIPPLGVVYEKASCDQKELFRVPFNLWLMDQLVEKGVQINELSSIQNTVQLFDLYWEYMVIKKDDSEDREQILRKATVCMVNKNTLSLDKHEFYIPKLNSTYKSLLSDQLLIPVPDSDQRLAFGHNILFDYAVSRLLIKEVPAEAFNFLLKDLSRPIFLRTSIDYFFARIWHSKRDLFWTTFWYFQNNSNGEYLSLIPIICLVNEIKVLRDFQPILDNIKKCNQSSQLHLHVLKRIFQTLKTINIDIIPRRDELWIEVLFQLKDNLDVNFIDEYIRLLSNAINRLPDWQESDHSKLAIMARTILYWAWKPPEGLNSLQIERLDEVVASWVVPLVCKTYSESPEESRKILSEILNRLGPDSTVSEIYRLVHGIKDIWPYDPDFVALVYESVFNYQELSDDKTFLGGHILTLTSTRRQDYNMCYYSLVEDFQKFLNAKPLAATKSMVKAIDAIVRRKELVKISGTIGNKSSDFQFYEVTTKYLPDNSYIWDEEDFDRERKKLLSSFDDYILKISKDIEMHELLVDLIKQIANINEMAVIWKHLIKTAKKNPSIFVPILYPLLVAKPILINRETSFEVGELLKIGFEYLTIERKQTVENTILKLHKNFKDDDTRNRIRKKVKTLLSCIPKKYLQEDKSKKIIEELERDKEKLENVKPFTMGKGTWGSCSEKDRLTEEGVDFKDSNNKRLQKLSIPVKEFHEHYLNKIPELKDCEAIFPKMCGLKKALEDSHKRYHQLIGEASLTDLAYACKTIVQNREIQDDHELLKFAENVFQEAAKNPSPKYDEKYDLKFDHPSWSPSPRIEAAQGLMNLINRNKFVTDENIELIKRLSNDNVPAVRYQITSNLLSMYKTLKDEMWNISENIALNENTDGVLTSLASSISRLARNETEKVLDLFEIICKRQSIDKRDRITLADPCLSTITSLIIIENNKRANKLINKYLENAIKFASEVKEIALAAKDYLIIGITKEWKGNSEEIRSKAKGILMKTLISSQKGFEELNNKYGDEWPEERQVKTKEVYEIVDTVGTWLYLLIYRKKEQKEDIIKESQKEKYYFEIKELIKKVIIVGKDSLLHASTAHNLIKLSSEVLKFDPNGVIEIAKDLCTVSANFGYVLDPMAIKEVVELIQSCIVDYKEIFKTKNNLKNLTELLNIFVKAGWPEAIKLSIELDKIWR